MTMKKSLIALAVALLVAVAIPAHAVPTYVVDFSEPTTRVDGSSFDASTELDHYDFMCGDSAGGPYDSATQEIPAGNTTVDLEASSFFGDGAYGDHYCVLMATDIDGLESPYSTEVELPWTAPPSAPGGPTINIILE